MPDLDDPLRFFVSAYHPDGLKMPAGPVREMSDRLRVALTWNVFRTLEQIAPSAWMRPLVASFGGLTDDYASAPHVCRVSCWPRLEPSPSAVLRRGRREPLTVDVLVDTDDTVVSVLVAGTRDMPTATVSEDAEGGLLDLLESTSYFAGVRAAYAAVVLPLSAESDVWLSRVRRRTNAAMRIFHACGRRTGNMRGAGALRWSDLRAILSVVAQSELIAGNERALARQTVRWMDEQLRPRELDGRGRAVRA